MGSAIGRQNAFRGDHEQLTMNNVQLAKGDQGYSYVCLGSKFVVNWIDNYLSMWKRKRIKAGEDQ